MRVRKPVFDFSATPVHWTPSEPEFAQMQNAVGFVIPHLEVFLNRVMARARTELKGESEALVKLRSDITTFIRQESTHLTVHGRFNDLLRNAGYPKLPELQRQIVAHYDGLMATKSLKFLLGYCEGFESILPPTASYWFDGGMNDVMADAEPNAIAMWRWHFVEEFEHRAVCHDAFHAMGGRYPMRAYTFLYQARCLARMKGWVMDHLMEVDRQKMTPAEVKRSKERERYWNKRAEAPVLKALPAILRPSYSPLNLPEPASFVAVRDVIERDWMAA